jgi:glycosyltransferase involved in cell wall biosynthesis
MVRDDNVLVLIPALNEAPTIARIVREVIDLGFTPVVIDDASSDLTATLAEYAGAVVLRSSFHLGVGGALRLGFRYAVERGATLVAQCDADGQHPPNQLRELIEAADRLSVDILVGARNITGSKLTRDSLFRQVAKRLLGTYASRVVGTKLTDTTSGFRVFRGQIIHELAKNMPNHFLGDTFEVMIVASRSGYKVAEINVEMYDREIGKSRASKYYAFAMTLRVLISAILRLDYRIRPKIN